MKFERCPTCQWKLAIPEKICGHPVTCPKCNQQFVTSRPASEDSGKLQVKRVERKVKQRIKQNPVTSTDKKTSTLATPTPGPPAKQKPQPAIRELPLPAAVTSPAKAPNRSPAEKPTAPQAASSLSVNPPAREPRAIEPMVPPESETTPVVPEATRPSLTARIIQADTTDTGFGNEGELPTLQLKEQKHKPRVTSNELRTSPIFLAILVSTSLITSGLILFFADYGTAVDQQALDRARAEIRRFYEVRIDVELKPYQVDLREAQLAHSRGDHEAEQEAYRRVMARFHAEDRNPFVGVTGSPTADAELEKLVATMLGDDSEP